LKAGLPETELQSLDSAMQELLAVTHKRTRKQAAYHASLGIGWLGWAEDRFIWLLHVWHR
jgi:hypothetical protein